MANIMWTQEYSVGHAAMDNDHKKLFAMLDEMHDAMKSGKGSAQVSEVVRKLKEYTQYHFSKEEDLMAKANYSGLAVQKEEHRKFVDKLTDLQTRIDKGAMLMASLDTSNLLSEWLQKHIMGLDKQYTGHLK